MKRKTSLVYDDENYIEAEYLDGTCPRCKVWEAPTTKEELKRMQEPHAYVGRGPMLKDRKVKYKKLTWKEYFKCPICQARFSVRFNDL